MRKHGSAGCSPLSGCGASWDVSRLFPPRVCGYPPGWLVWLFFRGIGAGVLSYLWGGFFSGIRTFWWHSFPSTGCCRQGARFCNSFALSRCDLARRTVTRGGASLRSELRCLGRGVVSGWLCGGCGRVPHVGVRRSGLGAGGVPCLGAGEAIHALWSWRGRRERLALGGPCAWRFGEEDSGLS